MGRLNRLRGRRAEREAARLRDALQTLGAPPQLRAWGQDPPDWPRRLGVADRIAAYTQGTVDAGLGAGPLLATAAVAEGRHPPPRRPSSAWRSGLVALWCLCAAALLVALAWRGVESAVSGTADAALMLVTLALFATSLFGAGANESPSEDRRSGSDRRKAPDCHPPFGLERRSGRDRRFGEAVLG